MSGVAVPEAGDLGKAAPEQRASRSWRLRLTRWFGGFVLLLALFGPILANDVPLMASRCSC